MNACARADFQPAGGIGRAGRSGQFGGLGRGARGEALAFLAVLDFPAEGGEFVAEFVAGGPLFVFAGGGAGFEEGLNLLGDGGGVGLESEHLVCLAPPIEEGARILRLAAEDAIKRQKPDEALNDFELGVQADPTWAQGWFNAALLAGELGFFADAADHMQNYLELMPNAADAQSARDQIDLWKYKAGQSPAAAQPAGVPGKK